MSARCSQCENTVEEKDLPRMVGARVLCPRCQQPMVMPAMTMPVSGNEALPTVFASKESGGALSPDKRYALVVLSGKEPGKVIPIDKARVTIGRSGCDVVLDDTELSRQHALIAINGTSARLEDLESTNGTYVDETRIQQAALDDRSEFRIGTHELLFVMTDREGPPQAAS